MFESLVIVIVIVIEGEVFFFGGLDKESGICLGGVLVPLVVSVVYCEG